MLVTPEGISDALKRNEVDATTGNRATVRLFAGWEFACVRRGG
jgi:uncharacterized protein YhjY with autotransporter beta-barrel domain